MQTASLLLLLAFPSQADSLLGVGAKEAALDAARAHHTRLAASPSAASDSLAYSHDLLGRCYRALSMHDSAEVSYERALIVRRAHLDPTDPQIATTLNNVGLAIWFGRSRTVALPLFEEALQIYVSMGADTTLDAIVCKTNLGNLYRLLDRTEEARDLFDEVLVFRRAYYDGPHVKLAAAIKNVARLERDLGNLSRALALYQEALAMEEQCGGTEYSGYASTLSDLARIYSRQGSWLQAELLEYEALLLRRERDPTSPATMKSLLLLSKYASARNDIARLESMIDEINRLESIQNKKGQSKSLFGAWENLSAALPSYSTEEQLARTNEFRVRVEAHPDRNLILPEVLERIAVLYRVTGNLPDARRAWADYESLLDELNHSHLRMKSWLLREKAAAYLAEGKIDSCALVARECIQNREEWGEGYSDHDLMLSEMFLAVAAFETGDLIEAERLARHASRVQQELRRIMAVGLDRSTIGWGAPQPLLAGILAESGNDREAIGVIEGFRGRSMLEMMQAHAAPANDSQRRLLALRDQLRSIDARIETLEDEQEPSAFRATIDSLQLERDACRIAWNRLHLEATQSEEARTASLDEIASALPSNAALIGWIETELARGSVGRWVYWIPSGGEPRIKRLPNLAPGSPHYDATRTSIYRREEPTAESVGWFVRNSVGPFEDEIESVDRLYVVPSEFLAGIPLAFAVPYKPLTFVTSGSVLTLKGRAVETHARKTSALIVSASQADRPILPNPDDSDAVVFDIASDWNATRNVTTGMRASDLGAIPWADSEADSISQRMAGSSIVKIRNAREERLLGSLADSMSQFDVVHLATHVLVDPERPYRSAIVLTQSDLPDPLEAARRGDPIYDGLLTCAEIIDRWRFDGSLVVLSGCGSGLGRPVRGEGYVGLPAALLQAGADQVVATLWPVNDRASSLFMSRFYESYFKGPDPGDAAIALTDAQNWLRHHEDGSGRDYSAPFYWAPYVLIGIR